MGSFQFSKEIEPSPMIGGHPGGVIAYPEAVVKLSNELYGKLEQMGVETQDRRN
ncbi:hypothetical protein [Cytobacillus kochii]|uniref:hypothetical protein n=1 Tax=Cytobacillus kochii TaxID=859143 RepID=UPI0025A110AE|nr:hypothetical protein [Cytobacillus kochii]MDM5207072.1 hypothetical protein [Cytobacillus kochii]